LAFTSLKSFLNQRQSEIEKIISKDPKREIVSPPFLISKITHVNMQCKTISPFDNGFIKNTKESKRRLNTTKDDNSPSTNAMRYRNCKASGI
jgi:hypothetical protein